MITCHRVILNTARLCTKSVLVFVLFKIHDKTTCLANVDLPIRIEDILFDISSF